MNINYLNIYNNLIKLTTNKKLYKHLQRQDIFADRLIILLLHFALFLKAFKDPTNKDILQEIYDFVFRQLELSLREIGYGDQTINKKMKNYINFFHSIISDLETWNILQNDQKINILSKITDCALKDEILVNYFDDYYNNLLKFNLNFYIKSVLEP